ncbi:hypothetical protein AB1Y20_019550 [Prymnesium parvum]|uniref:WW domain-containing protein n=1 Tax=Prymnesium parvum TaxID=97485 RepID=A0AB34JW70_PRYPA
MLSVLAVALSASGWAPHAVGPAIRAGIPATWPRSARAATPYGCASDSLERALALAVAREDFAEAARLKREIDAAATRQQAAAREQEASRQRFLLDSDSVEQMLATAGEGVVVLHFTAAEHSLANGMVRRVASLYAGSQIAGGTPVAFVQLSYDGVQQLGKASVFTDPRGAAAAAAAEAPATPRLPPGWEQATDAKTGRAYYISPTQEVTWDRPLTETGAQAQKLFEARGIDTLPTTQIWRKGKLLKQVGSMALEQALLDLKARPVTGSGFSARKGDERLRDRDQGTGLPSATAVDDIDFTGGKAGYGGTAFNTKYSDSGRTTGDYLPDLRDKPGDGMGSDGYPNPPSDRNDLPPGGSGRPPPRE